MRTLTIEVSSVGGRLKPPSPVVGAPPLSVVVAAHGHQVRRLRLGRRRSTPTAILLDHGAHGGDEKEAKDGGQDAEEELVVADENRSIVVGGGGRRVVVLAVVGSVRCVVRRVWLGVLENALFEMIAERRVGR